MIVVKKPKKLNETSFKHRKKELEAQEQIEQEQIQKAKKSPFSHFYQVNKDNADFLSSCLDENPKALKILLFIFSHMDKYNAVVCSYKVFQEALNMSKSTVQRSIAYLKDNGFISVGKSGTSNVYIANDNLVWNSWGNNREYCEFPANVVLSKSEQEECIKTLDRKIQTVQVKEE